MRIKTESTMIIEYSLNFTFFSTFIDFFVTAELKYCTLECKLHLKRKKLSHFGGLIFTEPLNTMTEK